MAQWGYRYGWHIRGKAGAVASGVLSVLMICHMAVVDVVQWRMRSELVSALTSYIRNPHEPVYMDYLPWDTWRWLTLAKVRGVPEPYEQSQLQHYASLYVSEDAPLMVVLPAEAENKEVASEEWPRSAMDPDGFASRACATRGCDLCNRRQALYTGRVC